MILSLLSLSLSPSFLYSSIPPHFSLSPPTPTSLQALLHSPHDPLLNLQSHPSAHLPTPPRLLLSWPWGQITQPIKYFWFLSRILLILGYFTLNLPTLNSRIPYTWTFYFLILYTEPFNLEFLIVRYFTLEPRTLIYPQPFNLRYFTPNLPILHTLTLKPLALSYFTLEPLTFRYFTLEPLTIRYFTLELLTFRYFTLEP